MKRTLYTLLATVAIALAYVFIISLSQDSEFTANFKLEDYLLYSPDRDSILQTGEYGTYVLDRSGRNLIVPILNTKNKIVDIVTINLENKAAVKPLANIGIPELNSDLIDDSLSLVYIGCLNQRNI
ncbi:MAG: hypothetical protein HC935_09310 [Pseudanabaena sp. SU_2_4]|nr:hypothetical protein [Pseudanabaena sp. SU_2_4]